MRLIFIIFCFLTFTDYAQAANTLTKRQSGAVILDTGDGKGVNSYPMVGQGPDGSLLVLQADNSGNLMVSGGGGSSHATNTTATIVSAGSMATSITSTVVDITYQTAAAIQAKWTGSPNGSIKVQISVDGTNYEDYSGSSLSVSGAGGVVWNLSDIAFLHMRVVYTAISGTGSLTVTSNIKGL